MRYTLPVGITRTHLLSILCLFVLGSGVHLLPFALHGAHPLGYDTGFYRRYLTEPLVSFPNTVVPGLGDDALVPRLILDTLRLSGMSPDAALYGSYAFFTMLLPILLYIWLMPLVGAPYALLGGVLLAISPVGYTAYTYMLYKNAFALTLLLLAYVWYERRQVLPFLLTSLLIAFSHKTSAIVYLASLGALLFIDRRRYRETLLAIAITGAALALATHSGGTLPRALSSGAVAVFLTWSDYLTLSCGTGIAALFAYRARHALVSHPTLLAFAGASFAFPLLHLPFYERIFVYADVALVALAVYGVREVLGLIDFDAAPRQAYALFLALCLSAGFTLGNFSHQVSTQRPLIRPAALATIQAAGALVPHDSYLLTTNTEAPWYQGWTQAHLIAPGMLRDRHNYESWVGFWEATSTAATARFLAGFPAPLYVSTTEDIATFIPRIPPCLTQVTETLWQSTCR